MSCSPFDLRDYFLKELTPADRGQVDGHLRSCASCCEELERLQMTEVALFSLRDEEIPQRIAFVSDKIFEPSPMRRWFDAFWGSTARLGFASAALLSCSIFYFAATRPAPAPNRPVVANPVTTAASPSNRRWPLWRRGRRRKRTNWSPTWYSAPTRCGGVCSSQPPRTSSITSGNSRASKWRW